MAAPDIGGVIPVLEVPFTTAEAPDLDGFRRVIAQQVAAGVHGVMFPGFASEFHKLSGVERRELTAVLLAELAGQDAPPAIISISDHAVEVARREAVAAVEAGANAINLLPPFLFGPSRAAILDHLATVLDAVAPTPVVIQHAPAQTGGALLAGDLADLARDHPNLAAIKVESQPPGKLISALLDQDPALPSLVGYAGLHAIDALDRGAVGIQPGCSFPELYVELHARFTRGDRDGAEDLHGSLLPYLSAWMQHVELIVAVEKEISVARGWFPSATVRRPGWELDRREHARIDRFLDEFSAWLT
jgi:dihydrodipicolinate synthase/N-acetylneuraminate lyase